MVKLAHIVNPVKVGEGSDLFFAQPVTFKTMEVARDFAKDFGVEVELFSAQYPEDHEIVPETFIKTPDLGRSVLDFGEFKKPRKLPLIQDILDRLYQNTDAEYLIYTNVDIALMPNFYTTVSQFLEQGYDSFCINRRTISKNYTQVKEFPLMYSEVGKKHLGHDCFIFSSQIYPSYKFGKVSIGAIGLGRCFLINQTSWSENFREFDDRHLTFHIGNDKVWKSQEYDNYKFHNLEEVKQIIESYKKQEKLLNSPLVEALIKKNEEQLGERQGNPIKKQKTYQQVIRTLVKKFFNTNAK